MPGRKNNRQRYIKFDLNPLTFDSDFPSLSGPARPQQNNGGWGNSNVVRQPHQAQPQQAQAPAPPIRAPSTAPSHQSIEQFDGPRSQQPSTDRSGGADDYQSANGSSSATGDTGRQNGFGSSVLGSPNESNPPVNGQQTQLPIRNSSNSFPPNSQAPIGSGQPTPPSQALSQPPSAPLSNGQTGENGPEPATKKWADMTEGERWGLAGLNAIFEARRQSETGGQIDDTLPPHIRNTAVIMGQDLNTLGMDLDSPEELIHTFSVWPSQHQSDSIFNYRDHHTVPAFQVPQAYTVTNVPPMSTRMGAFSDGMFACHLCDELFANSCLQRHSFKSSSRCHAISCKKPPQLNCQCATGAGTRSSANGFRRILARPILARRCRSMISLMVFRSVSQRCDLMSAASEESTSSSTTRTGAASVENSPCTMMSCTSIVTRHLVVRMAPPLGPPVDLVAWLPCRVCNEVWRYAVDTHADYGGPGGPVGGQSSGERQNSVIGAT